MSILHRYNSAIHGNYRRAYLRSGLLTGALLALSLVVRRLVGQPADSPVSLISDGLLLACIFLLAVGYRNRLPSKKASLKELMLFGTGTAVVASIVYGLSVWGFSRVDTPSLVQFVHSLAGQTVSQVDPQLPYWSLFIALIALLEVAVLGSFAAFLAAVLFKTESPTVKK